jgi:predicted metal-binding membrane protein
VLLAAAGGAWVVLNVGSWMPESVASYVATWGLMMTAMMLPSIVPLVALYPRLLDTGLLAVAYLVVWAATGSVAYAVDMHVEIGAAVVLFAAGVYELTPVKAACLKRCRAPIDFVFTHWRGGQLGPLRLGLEHGVYCVGCCWALMAVLVLAAGMGLVWAAVLAGVVFVQKVLPLSQWTSRATAVTLLVAALIVEVA